MKKYRYGKQVFLKIMKFNKLTPNLMVTNVQKTINFYQELLGFEFVMGVPADSQQVLTELPSPERQLVYALMKRGNIELMFQLELSLREDIPAFNDSPLSASVTFYFEVTDLKSLYESIKEKTTIVKDLHTTWYGLQEFYIRDLNGYILGFSQAAS